MHPRTSRGLLLLLVLLYVCFSSAFDVSFLTHQLHCLTLDPSPTRTCLHRHLLSVALRFKQFLLYSFLIA